MKGVQWPNPLVPLLNTLYWIVLSPPIYITKLHHLHQNKQSSSFVYWYHDTFAAQLDAHSLRCRDVGHSLIMIAPLLNSCQQCYFPHALWRLFKRMKKNRLCPNLLRYTSSLVITWIWPCHTQCQTQSLPAKSLLLYPTTQS